MITSDLVLLVPLKILIVAFSSCAKKMEVSDTPRNTREPQ